jgi:hypothetical protein
MPVAPKYGNREQRIQYRRNMVLRYTIAGFGLDQIMDLYNSEVREVDPAMAVGIDTLRDDRRAVLKDMADEFTTNRHAYRALLVERAELVLRTLYTPVKAGNLGAIDRWQRTLAFIAEISGANAPIKVEVSNTTALTPEERAERMRNLIELAQSRAALTLEEGEILDITPEQPPLLESSNDRDPADR